MVAFAGLRGEAGLDDGMPWVSDPQASKQLLSAGEVGMQG